MELDKNTKKQGLKKIFLPLENCSEASLVAGLDIIPLYNLRDFFLSLTKEIIFKKYSLKTLINNSSINNPPLNNNTSNKASDVFDFSKIHGQEQAKRALKIAIAGGHNILLSGPPGSGKTSLAQAAMSILPPLSAEESLAIAQIYSAADIPGINNYSGINNY